MNHHCVNKMRTRSSIARDITAETTTSKNVASSEQSSDLPARGRSSRGRGGGRGRNAGRRGGGVGGRRTKRKCKDSVVLPAPIDGEKKSLDGSFVTENSKVEELVSTHQHEEEVQQSQEATLVKTTVPEANTTSHNYRCVYSPISGHDHTNNGDGLLACQPKSEDSTRVSPSGKHTRWYVE